MPDRRVAGDPFGQRQGVGDDAAFGKLLDALVDEPQPGLELQDGLARRPRTGSGRARSGRRGPARPGSRRPRCRATVRNGYGSSVSPNVRRSARRRDASGTSRPASAGAGRAGAAADDPPPRCRRGRAPRVRTGRPGRTVLPGSGSEVRIGSWSVTSSTRRSGLTGDEEVDDAEGIRVVVTGDQGESIAVVEQRPARSVRQGRRR